MADNRRILIIDDNPAIHEDFRKILTLDQGGQDLADAEAAFFGEPGDTGPRLEVEVDSAHQGQEGLEKVAAAISDNRPYALAFVDMRMPPGWDGLKTIEEVWKVDPALQIVICTAYSDNSWSDICERLGRTDQLLILKKPFDNAEVCQIALALTEKWNLSRQARLKQHDLERLVDERTSQLREKEKALRHKQKLETIGSLAGGIAHEFNNLLQVIRGYTRFAMDELAEESQPYHDLTHVVKASDQAAMITSQLLSFSRKQPSQKTNLATNDIATTTLKMVKPVLGEQIELTTNLDDETGIVHVDANIMSQVLLNLCINARDAMADGGKLTVETEQTEIVNQRGRLFTPRQPNLKPGNYAVITVTDTGTGIPDDVIERVFDPFFTTKEVGKGSGMGLAMVFGAAQDHDGTVTVESIDGIGSTFRIFLPVVCDSISENWHAKVDDERTSLTGSETILVAEDEPAVRDVTVRTLLRSGYNVITATNGEDAVDQFQQNSDGIDLAILDVVMPGLNGHQALDRMKTIRPTVKAIFCTGYDPDTAQIETCESEPVATIYKPVSPEALLVAVRQTLEEHSTCHAI